MESIVTTKRDELIEDMITNLRKTLNERGLQSVFLEWYENQEGYEITVSKRH